MQPTPALSIILCSRNDTYMGDPVARLQLALNYLAANLASCGLESAVEIVVTDWGSASPLRNAVKLSSQAARVSKFVEVPQTLAAELQRDSAFAEVIALNAAARRSSGKYIARIDQDTLVGCRFLRYFFLEVHGSDNSGADTKILFAQRRQIPFEFSSQNPSLTESQKFLRYCGRFLPVDVLSPFFHSPVGIMLMSKAIWCAAGGYDERMIHWGWMEVDFIRRLTSRYRVVDIGPITGYDFYHLEHYPQDQPRNTSRKLNATSIIPSAFHPNTDMWGLADRELSVNQASSTAADMLNTFRPRINIRIARLFVARILVTLGRLLRAATRPRRYGDYLRRIGLSVRSLRYTRPRVQWLI
jgi:hypothetical protein